MSGRTPSRSRALLLAAAVIAPGCGPSPSAWVPLGMQEWSMGSGDEAYTWLDFQVDRDLRVAAIRPKDPPGTHHIVLRGPGDYNDLFVSVVGTTELDFPPGVRLLLRKGATYSTQIHLVNASREVLSGTSGVEVLPDPSTDGGTPAEANLRNAARRYFSLPAHQRTTLPGTCTLEQDETLFAIAPHMHRLGVHQRTVLVHEGRTTVLFDGDFRFESQRYLPIGPISARQGDVLQFECTWDNTTDEDVPFGNEAAREMCMAQIYRYPAGSGDFCEQ